MSDGWRRVKRPRGLLSLLLGACVLGGAALAGFQAFADRRDTVAVAEAVTGHQALFTASYLGRTFDAADQVLLRAEDLARTGVDRAGQLDGSVFAPLLPVLAQRPYLAALVVVDVQGRPLFDSRQENAATGEGREAWVSMALGGEGTVVTSAALGVGPVFTMARPLRSGSRLVGAVGLSLPVSLLSDVVVTGTNEFAVHPGLFNAGGRLLVGPDFPAGALSQGEIATLIAAHSSGTVEVAATAAHPALIGSFYPVPSPLPALTVCVVTVTDEVLAPWRQRTMVAAGAGVLVLAVVIGLSWILAVELRRDRARTAALRVANHELRRSNSDLEQFAYVASHDLKEPLRNIASYVQLLQRRYQGHLDADADAFIGYTVDGVRRMQVIINELLAYSRIGTGPVIRHPVQTGVLVSAALANLKTVIAEAGAAVEVVGPLPVAKGDAGQLGSVFQNLLSNALKYRRDDVRPELRITVEENSATWLFSVIDNGIGIEPQYHRQIFELFKRLHARDRYGGTGIGLAVCQRVIERHGGEIWVDSVPGKGTAFRFTLPKETVEPLTP